MKFSVIIPVYNTEPFLVKCIDSIVNQTYKNLEIIIINDGSTDGSKQIIESYAKIDSRIIAIHQKNGGIGSAYRAAFKISTGDYISFVDSDDFVSLNMFSYLVSKVKKTNPEIIHFGKEFIDILGNSISQVKPENIIFTKSIDNILYEHFEKIKDPSLACKVFKKELFENVVLLNQNIGIDEILYPQLLLKSTSILHIPDIYYYVLIRPTSVSRSNYTIKKIEDYITVHRFICELFEKNKPEFAFYIHIKYIDIAIQVYDQIYNKLEFIESDIVKILKQDILYYYQELKKTNNLNKLNYEYKLKCSTLQNASTIYPIVNNFFWGYKIIKNIVVNL